MIAFVAVCLSLPIVLFHALDYPANPAFLLIPLIALAMIKQRRSMALLLYVAAAFSGLAACLIANALRPDGELLRHLLSLVLLLFPVSFVVLGRWAIKQFSIAHVARLLAVFSAIFCIALVGRLLLTGEAFRVYVGPLGLAALNATFFGMPVAWTNGVLSLAQMILMQSLLCLAGMFGEEGSMVERALCAIGAACAVLLVLKSEARSAQIGLVIPALSLAWAIFSYRPQRLSYAMAIAVLVVAGSILVKGTVADRLAESAVVVSKGGETASFDRVSPTPAPLSTSPNITPAPVDSVPYSVSLANISNGRFGLYTAALTDIVANPWIGTGFGGWGRFSDYRATGVVALSTQTHIYWLTLLWKGGLLFFLPIMAFFAICYADMLRNRAALLLPEGFFLVSSVVAAHAMSFSWDLLNAPTAGALAFFLLGILGEPSARRPPH